jgi:hypothetical protein
MNTLRGIVSNIRSMHRLLSTDAMITDRVIASEVRTAALLLIKRETNLRKLWATDTLFTTVPCLEMEEVPISECCSYPEEKTIARSRFKLPRIAQGNYNYVIQGVYSINAMGGEGKRLKEISINRYLNMLKLSLRKPEEYFWINNDYLYITNPDVKAVRISALFEHEVPNEIMHPEDCDCGDVSVSEEEYCKNPLDKSFFLPGYLEQQVSELVSISLKKNYFNIQGDISSEGIDGQQVNSNPTN